MRYLLHLLLLFVIIKVFTFCSKKQGYESSKYNYDIERAENIKKLHGIKISIVDTLELINSGVDDKSANSKSYTLVSKYIASCTPCLIKMKKWEKLIGSGNLFNDVNFVFYAKNNLTWYFNHQVNEVNSFPFKIFHDPADVFSRVNKAPELAYVMSILLDQNHEIIYAGNPMEIDEEYTELVSILGSKQ